jgi:hypothetical protein
MRECRYLLAMDFAAKRIWAGEVVYSPIVHSHPMAVAHNLGLDFATWERQDHAMIRACERMVVLKLDGWRESKGVRAEIEYARSKGKRVSFVRP